MLIHFVRDNSLVSRVIRFFTLSEFSHVAIQISSDIWEATMMEGVTRTTLAEFRDKYPVTVTRKIWVDTACATGFLNRQVRKKYDWGGLFGFIAQRDWQNQQAWFCSELAAGVIKHCGNSARKLRVDRVTPRDLFNLIEWAE